MRKEILEQVRFLTKYFIEKGLAVTQNFPKEIGQDIIWDGYQGISFSLKTQVYADIYNVTLSSKEYNFVFTDGGIIQMMYTFHKDTMLSHRLAYYPPHNSSALNEDEESEYHSSNKMPIPIRFDFDSDVKKFKEVVHSYTHFTLGDHEKCRIPVSAPVTPFRFIDFIIRAFYMDFYERTSFKTDIVCPIKMTQTMYKDENSLIHLSFHDSINHKAVQNILSKKDYPKKPNNKKHK
jgi:hypothetical protein